MFDISWSGWRRVHAASKGNSVYEITLYPALSLSRENVGKMDCIVIQ